MTAFERLLDDYAKKFHLSAIAGALHGKTQAQRLAETEAARQAVLRYRDEPSSSIGGYQPVRRGAGKPNPPPRSP